MDSNLIESSVSSCSSEQTERSEPSDAVKPDRSFWRPLLFWDSEDEDDAIELEEPDRPIPLDAASAEDAPTAPMTGTARRPLPRS